MAATVDAASAAGSWRPTACVLCACNCGIEVQVADGNLSRVKGDKAHPGSQGYACEKAQRLFYYQSNPRIVAPLRRREDGTYEEVDWDTAIAEVAAGLAGVRDAHGGGSIFYYGGGGQGNHLGGVYSGALRSALGVRFSSNALAQEKTGEIWIDAHLFGHVTHTTPDFQHAEVAVFVGKNPWMAHGFPHARPTLKAIAADPGRTLIVIDPHRSETAAMADIHLQVRPGGDVFLLAGMLATLVQEDLLDYGFLQDRTENHEAVLDAVRDLDVTDYAQRAGVDAGLVRQAARRIGTATSVSILEDLGIQQAPHSTLNSYLEKLLWALTGHFARPGCTNACASYVLPALTQYEKYECTFFNIEFPHNVFHLRAPVIPAPEGPLGEPEIHRRLVWQLGALNNEDLAGLREAAAEGLDAYAAALGARLGERPHLVGLAPVVLYETLGPELADGAAAAAGLWGAAQLCAATYPESVRGAGLDGDGIALGNALFEAVLRERRGLVFSRDGHEINWEWIRRARSSGRIDLAIPELIHELTSLDGESDAPDAEFPFILSAGERRTNTAMTLIRDPAWRKRDLLGALRISPQDAHALTLTEGDLVAVTTRRGHCTAPVEITDMMRPGHISLPNGYGLAHGAGGPVTGVAPNELTDSSRRDWLAGTPWHKNVPARLETVHA